MKALFSFKNGLVGSNFNSLSKEGHPVRDSRTFFSLIKHFFKNSAECVKNTVRD